MNPTILLRLILLNRAETRCGRNRGQFDPARRNFNTAVPVYPTTGSSRASSHRCASTASAPVTLRSGCLFACWSTYDSLLVRAHAAARLRLIRDQRALGDLQRPGADLSTGGSARLHRGRHHRRLWLLNGADRLHYVARQYGGALHPPLHWCTLRPHAHPHRAAQALHPGRRAPWPPWPSSASRSWPVGRCPSSWRPSSAPS